MIVYDDEEVGFRTNEYRYGGGLAVQMDYNDREDGWMPYVTLTVNLEDGLFSSKSSAFIDSNNMPNVGKWLEDNGFAYGTGLEMPSGFCTYELYDFSKRFFEAAGVTPPNKAVDFAMGTGKAHKDGSIDLNCEMLAKNGEIMPVTITDVPENLVRVYDWQTNRAAVELADDAEYNIQWEATDRYAAGSVVRTGADLKPLVFGAMDKRMEDSFEHATGIDYSVPGVDGIHADVSSYEDDDEYD